MIASAYIIKSSNDEEKEQELLQKTLQKIKVINDRLVELDKHKDDFVSIAAHQLRTPAGVIKNYVSMMKQGLYGELPEKLTEPIGRVYENGALLAETVSSLLDISRIESGRQKINFVKNNIENTLSDIVDELKDLEKGLYLDGEIYTDEIPFEELGLLKKKSFLKPLKNLSNKWQKKHSEKITTSP